MRRRNGLFLALLLGACTPQMQTIGPVTHQARLETTAIITPDGAHLPVTIWPAMGQTKAVVVALHGFTDYRNAFALPAPTWQQAGITTLAFDQRGFGGTERAGIWGGLAAYRADLTTAHALARQRFGAVPIYWLGESMGGAIVILTATDPALPVELRPDGIVLASPALLAKPLAEWQRWLLSTASHVVPWAMSGHRGIPALPTDNIPLLRAMRRDPMVQKEVRLDQVYGLLLMMEQAIIALPRLKIPTLMIVGDHDGIVPRPAWENALRVASTPGDALCGWKIPGGYHMILRDHAAEKRWPAIADWILGLGNPADCR